jgi:hypothetical protein
VLRHIVAISGTALLGYYLQAVIVALLMRLSGPWASPLSFAPISELTALSSSLVAGLVMALLLRYVSGRPWDALPAAFLFLVVRAISSELGLLRLRSYALTRHPAHQFHWSWGIFYLVALGLP